MLEFTHLNKFTIDEKHSGRITVGVVEVGFLPY